MNLNFDQGNFFRMTNEAVLNLNDSDFKTYSALLMRADVKTQTCFPSWKRLSTDTNKSRRTIARSIQRLKDMNVITIHKRGFNASSLYSFNDPRV